MFLRRFACLALFATVACAQDLTPVVHVDNPPNLAAQQAKHYVVLVSLDGFRYDYTKVHGTPNLDKMGAAGVSTPDGMFPSYPSITFPNHYALVTGLRPEHHGIAAMSFYDPLRKESYSYNDSKTNSDGSWYQGTPLWVLAEEQGMRSACMFWPGSEAAIQGVRPTFYLRYDDNLDYKIRVDQVIAWLKLPAAERPHFITLYYPQPDHNGHTFGPDAPETRDAVHHVDDMIGLLREALKSTGLPVDLIVTADHGMIKTDPQPVVLDQFANLDHFKTDGQYLYAETEADAEKAYEEFKAHPSPKFEVYRRLDAPTRLHINATARLGDPVIVAKGPYQIYAHAPRRQPNIGSHGFDPYVVPQMKAIFYAEGPDIAHGVKLKSFDNVDVFSLIAKLLALDAPATDGTLAPLAPALKH